MKRGFVIVAAVFVCVCFMLGNSSGTKEDNALKGIISEELEKIDLSELERLYEQSGLNENETFFGLLGKLIGGNFDFNDQGFISYAKKLVLNDVCAYAPLFAAIVAVTILCSLLSDAKSSYMSDSVGEIVNLVGFLAILTLIAMPVLSFWRETKNIIENIAKSSEIMSPIMLTLMVASGGKASAALYKPSLVFLTNGVIGAYSAIILPLSGLIGVFSCVAIMSPRFRFSKFTEFFGAVIKWLVGLIMTVFGVFLTIKGISAASYDGISFKAAKYVVSNSVPLVGGFIKEGFDLVIAGSVLIKNSIGIIGVFMLVMTVIVPLIRMAIFSLLLKATAALTESFSFSTASALLTSFSKTVGYFAMCLITVGFMFFIVVLLMIISANGVI